MYGMAVGSVQVPVVVTALDVVFSGTGMIPVLVSAFAHELDPRNACITNSMAQ